MSCVLTTISNRTVYAATATSRSLSSRATSSSSAINRTGQGNINSKRYQQTRAHGDARPFSTAPKWSETDNGTVWGFTGIYSLLTAGGATAYIAYDTHEDEVTTQCSSLIGMATEHDVATVLKENIFGPTSKLRRTLTPAGGDTKRTVHVTKKVTLKRRSASRLPTPMNGGAFNTMTHEATTSTLKGGMLEVVEASVEKASDWEKKAKAAVDRLRAPTRYDVSVRALRGGRLSMEDTYCVHDGGRFAGVFDGHGGAAVSKYSSETIYDKIHRNVLESSDSSVPSLAVLVKSIGAAFEELDDEVLNVDDFQYQGSTAVTVYVHEDSKTNERTIISANVGDSRAVLSHGCKAVDLTRDHKPDDEDEKKRILAMGETIEWDSYCQVSRVKSLSLSRAIGDRFAKPVVSGEAEIQLFPLEESVESKINTADDFVILASDGLWDVMTSQDCVDLVHERLNPSAAQVRNMSKSELRQHKLSRRKNISRFMANEASRRGSCDNICVVILWLNDSK